ncbi:MAG: methyltransferase domain-containing protein [Candidatus Brocadiia bacterium]
MTPDDDTYVVTCLYGLEEELASEAAGRLEVAAEHHWSEAVFEFDGPVERLRELRLAGNVFLQFDSFLIGPEPSDLDDIAERLRSLPVERWEQRWAELNGDPPAGPDISVSVKRSGHHRYTYKDVEEVAWEVIPDALGRRAVGEPRPLELRIEVLEERCRLRGRLTPEPLSRRPYKVRYDRSETHPALAAAMLRLSEPVRDERFLDPFCGTGTIPIERTLLGPAELIVAGDASPRRAEWAVMNAEAAGADVHVAVWDAHTLPFPDRCFTRIVTTPPHSDPTDGRPWDVEDFARLIAEPLRVLEYGGFSVWLTRHARLLERAVELVGLNRIVETLRCEWKGRPCYVYALEKVP